MKVPSVQLNGDIRMPINFDFIERHVSNHSGWTMTTPFHDNYRVLLCAYGMDKPRLNTLRLSYKRFFINQSNDIIHSITSDLTNNTPFSLHLLIQLLRLSSFDPDFLIQAKQSLHNVNSDQVLSHVNIHDLTVDLSKVNKEYKYDCSANSISFLSQLHMIVVLILLACICLYRSIKWLLTCFCCLFKCMESITPRGLTAGFVCIG